MALEKEERTALASASNQHLDAARNFVIESVEDVEHAAGFVRACRELEKQIKSHHDPIKSAAHKAWKVACEQEKKVLAPVQQAQKIVRGLIAGYEADQERLRLEAAKVAQEEAKQIAGDFNLWDDGSTTETEALVPLVAEEPDRAENVSFREVYDGYEIIQFDAIPREFLVVNESMLKAAQKNGLTVPGIQILTKKVAVVR